MLEHTLRIQRQFCEQGLVPAFAVAATCARLGEKRETLQYLERAYKTMRTICCILGATWRAKNYAMNPNI
jgi:hypothetical protein